MSTLAKKLNTGLNLSSKLAVVAGGSQGIGAGIAVRLAEAGSSVIVVGRSESRMTHVINECKRVSPNGPSGKIFDFISADLGAAAGIKEAISEIKAKSNNSVNYLFTTQGGPPNGSYTLNADGVESGFAVQVMGRFAMNQQLAEAGVLKEASVSVAAPGGSQTEYDVDDIEVRSVRGRNAVSVLLALAKNQGLVTDAATKALQSRYPGIAFFHLFPGIVTTNGAANQGFPFPLPQLFALASPVISRTVGNSPQSYADIPVLLAANTGAEKQEIVKREGNFLGQTLKRIQPAPWTEDKANQDKIYEKLRSYH